MHKFFIFLIHWVLASPFFCLTQNKDTLYFGKQKIILDKNCWSEIKSTYEKYKELFFNCQTCKKQFEFIQMTLPLIQSKLIQKQMPIELKYLSFLECSIFWGGKEEGLWQARGKEGLKDLGLINSQDGRVDERWNISLVTDAALKLIEEDNNYYHNWLLAAASFKLTFQAVKNGLNEMGNDAYLKHKNNLIFEIHTQISSNIYNFILRYLGFSLFVEEILSGIPQNFKFVEEAVNTGASIKKYTKSLSYEKNKFFREDNRWIKKNCKYLPDNRYYKVVLRDSDINHNDNTFFILDKFKVYKESLTEKNNTSPIEINTKAFPNENKLEDNSNVSETPIENNFVQKIVENQNEKEDDEEDDEQDIKVENAPKPYFITHTVKKGQTLYSIARFYNVQLNEIRNYNEISDINKIYVGQSIRIIQMPKMRGTQNNFLLVHNHISLDSLAKMYDITPKDLKQKNNFYGENIFVQKGQILLIDKKIFINVTQKKYFNRKKTYSPFKKQNFGMKPIKKMANKRIKKNKNKFFFKIKYIKF